MPINDESAKQSAEEYLATKLEEERQAYEHQLNMETAFARSPLVWKSVKDTIIAKCAQWNEVTQEETLTCKETLLGDIRIWCAARAKQMTVQFDSKRLLITVKNAARLENETDVVMRIQGYWTGTERDTRLIHSEQVVNIDLLILSELRVLAGMSRQRIA
jgi:hypothetical protein